MHCCSGLYGVTRNGCKAFFAKYIGAGCLSSALHAVHKGIPSSFYLIVIVQHFLSFVKRKTEQNVKGKKWAFIIYLQNNYKNPIDSHVTM
jgi:hypothetical protein